MNSIRCRISLLFSLLYIVALISAQNGVLNLDLSLPPSIYSIDQRSQRDIYVAFYESSSVKKLCDVQVALYSQGLIPCVVRRGDLASFNTASGNAQLRAVFYVKSTGRIIESRPMTVNLGESPYQSRSQSILSAALSPIKNLITAVLIGLSTAHAQLVNGLLTIAGSLSGAATAVLRASAVSIGSTASVTILAAFLTLGPKPGFGRGGASSGSTSRPISTIRGSFSGFKLNLPVLTIKADTPKTLSSTKNDKLSLTNTSTSVRTEQPKESNLAIKKSVRSMLSRGATVVAAGLITVALMMLSKPSERERVEQRPKSVFKLLPKPQPQSQPQLKSPVRQQVIPTSVAVKKKEGKILKATPQKVIIKSVPVKPTMKESKKAQPVKSMVKQQVLRIIPVKSEPTTKVANTRVTAIISKTPVKKVDKTVAPVKANKPVSKPPQQVKRVFGTQKQTSNLYDFSKTGSTTKTVPSTIRGSAIATAGKTIKPVVIKQASKSKLAVQVPEKVPSVAVKTKRVFGSNNDRKSVSNDNKQQKASSSKSNPKSSQPTIKESKSVVESLFMTLRPRYVDTDFSSSQTIKASQSSQSSSSSSSSSSQRGFTVLLSVYLKTREILRVGGAQLVSSLVSVLASGKYVAR